MSNEELKNIALEIRSRDMHEHEWPFPSIDGGDWARALNKGLKEKGLQELDESILAGWFGAAILRGFLEGERATCQ